MIFLRKCLTLAKQYKKIKIKSFKASEDVLSCMKFFEGHAKVIKNINNSFINNNQWFGSKHIYGILAEYQGEEIGGLLLFHPFDQKKIFPFEELMLGTTTNYQLSSDDLTPPCAELFAVWNTENTSGWGISFLLLKAGLALSYKLGIERTYYVIAEYNLRLAEKIGLVPLKYQGANIFNIIKTSFSETKVFICYFNPNDVACESNGMESILEIAKRGEFTTNESVLGSHFEIEYEISL